MGNCLVLLVVCKFVGVCGEDWEVEDDWMLLVICGSEGLMVIYVKCCYLLFGDIVIGYLSVGKGIVVYCDICKNLFVEMCDVLEKCIVFNWDKDVEQEFIVVLCIELVNKCGVLVILVNVVFELGFNIDIIDMVGKDFILLIINVIFIVKYCIYLVCIIKWLCIVDNVVRIYCISV